MSLTKLPTVFTKTPLIFSKMIDNTHTEVLEINVKYRFAVKPRHYSIGLLLIFQNTL